jgi:hypothetical protein
MPRPQRRRSQDNEQIRLARSSHEELVKLREAVEKSTEAISRSAEKSMLLDVVLILLTMAVFLTGYLAIIRDSLAGTLRAIVFFGSFVGMSIALALAAYVIYKMRRVIVNSKRST